jgi:riboflavin kinase/FMN adenylyltransferase
MRHVQTLDDLRVANAFVTIGAFDGVHRGHQVLLRQLSEEARAQAGVPVVLTFHPHPAVVLRGIETPYYLTSPEERARLLEQSGIELVVTLPFNRELAAVGARDFVLALKARLGMRELWVGYDFALGRGREGDIPFLQRLGGELDFDLRVVEPFSLGEQAVSSSQIRALLREGAVSQAAQLLGRSYGFAGPVVHGDGRGRSIGIPTANVQAWEGQLLPRNGVYATWASVDGLRRPAVTNVGMRPTFENTPPVPRVEALLLDFDQDLYGKTVRLDFVEFLRPEQRFAGVQALLEQIELDKNRAREVLQNER